MSPAITRDRDAGPLRRAVMGPAEGWTTVGAVGFMILVLAWSIDDAKWVRGIGPLTDFLPAVGFAGAAIGLVGAKVGWGRWTTHLVGVVFAALILPIVAGGILLGDSVVGLNPATISLRYHTSAEVITRVWVDLAIRGLPLTSEYGHYFIAMGALLWAAGQYAAYGVFGHHRPVDVAIVLGLLLLANMSLTRNDQLYLIVLFSLAALVLLMRAHAVEEGSTWLRRRIGDPESVKGIYLRGGSVFIAAAVVGSLVLTFSASSAPLQGAWKEAPRTLAQVSQWLQRYVPLGGASRSAGVVVFGEHSAIIGSWTQDDGTAFVAQLPTSEDEQFRWRIGAYAQFDLNGWSWGDTTEVEREADEALLASSADNAATLLGRREVRAEITPESLASDYVVSPQTIQFVDQPSTVRVTGTGRWFSTVEFEGASKYEVTALVPVVGDVPGGITENRLRVASREYSSDIRRLYLQVPQGALGPRSLAILDEVRARSADNPYDLALTLQNYLRDPSRFRYDTNVQSETQTSCADIQSTVECFARIRAGYCQYYASTMAILLRQAGVPTRLAQGFLPGERSANGTEVVRNVGAHAWVEVYFPYYGWVDFDPTGGGVGRAVVIPSGAPASPTPRPSLGLGTDFQVPDDDDGLSGRSPLPGTPGSTGSGGSSGGPFVVIFVLLAIGGMGLVLIVKQRGPRSMDPGDAWGSVARWSRRFGLAPRPSQTIYEFAGSLGDALPGLRPELSTVASAKVEIAYGGRDLGPARLRGVADAYRRLRIGLLRLVFRRGLRRRGPRRSG